MRTPPTTLHTTVGLRRIDADARYADRMAAGWQLAQLLLRERGSRALVLALPPGGVVVGGELARVLRLPLDVVVAREIVIRPQPSLIAGAMSEGCGLCLNRAVFQLPGASLTAFWRETRRTSCEIVTLAELYRHGRLLPSLHRRPVILVDDGLGDGLVQLAALAAVRRMHAAHCIVATPFATPGATQRLARHTDLVLTLASVEVDQRAGHTYWHSSLDDEAAAALLEHDRQRNEDVC